jgi:hypothetical protein
VTYPAADPSENTAYSSSYIVVCVFCCLGNLYRTVSKQQRPLEIVYSSVSEQQPLTVAPQFWSPSASVQQYITVIDRTRGPLGFIFLGESSLDDCSAQVFPYNIFAYCSICRVECKFARNNIIKKNNIR